MFSFIICVQHYPRGSNHYSKPRKRNLKIKRQKDRKEIEFLIHRSDCVYRKSKGVYKKPREVWSFRSSFVTEDKVNVQMYFYVKATTGK